MRTKILAAFALSLAPLAVAADGTQAGVSLTVYSSADPAGFDPRQIGRASCRERV